MNGPFSCKIFRATLVTLVFVGLGTTVAADHASATELRVSAAMSLRPALQKALVLFGRKHPDIDVTMNASSSGRLRMQIEAGAPCDVFVSASSREMDLLEAAGFIVAGTRMNIAANELVVIAPRSAHDDVRRLEDLIAPRVRRVALGTPRSVPAGMYAEEGLRYLGLWDELAGKFVFCEHVRQVLDYVVRAEVDAGLLYRTDAMLHPDHIRIVATLPAESHRPITYPAAVIAGTRAPRAARLFMRFLGSDDLRDILRGHGFVAGATP